MTTLFWKALFAFLALPGVVAFAVPLIWLKPASATAVASRAIPCTSQSS